MIPYSGAAPVRTAAVRSAPLRTKGVWLTKLIRDRKFVLIRTLGKSQGFVGNMSCKPMVLIPRD